MKTTDHQQIFLVSLNGSHSEHQNAEEVESYLRQNLAPPLEPWSTDPFVIICRVDEKTGEMESMSISNTIDQAVKTLSWRIGPVKMVAPNGGDPHDQPLVCIRCGAIHGARSMLGKELDDAGACGRCPSCLAPMRCHVDQEHKGWIRPESVQ